MTETCSDALWIVGAVDSYFTWTATDALQYAGEGG
jgi:hypothetical protein